MADTPWNSIDQFAGETTKDMEFIVKIGDANYRIPLENITLSTANSAGAKKKIPVNSEALLSAISDNIISTLDTASGKAVNSSAVKAELNANYYNKQSVEQLRYYKQDTSFETIEQALSDCTANIEVEKTYTVTLRNYGLWTGFVLTYQKSATPNNAMAKLLKYDGTELRCKCENGVWNVQKLVTEWEVITTTWVPFDNFFHPAEIEIFQDSWNNTPDYEMCNGSSKSENEPWWQIKKRPGTRPSTGYIESRAGFFLLRHDDRGWYLKKLNG